MTSTDTHGFTVDHETRQLIAFKWRDSRKIDRVTTVEGRICPNNGVDELAVFINGDVMAFIGETELLP